MEKLLAITQKDMIKKPKHNTKIYQKAQKKDSRIRNKDQQTTRKQGKYSTSKSLTINNHFKYKWTKFSKRHRMAKWI